MLARLEEQPAPADGVTVAALDGEIDASNTAEIAESLRALLSNRSTTLIVDLTGTTYLDSAAINLFFKLSGDLVQRQQQLRLVVPDGAPIARAMTITGLDATVPLHATRAEAIVRATGG